MSDVTILPSNHISVLASKMILHMQGEMVDFDQIVCIECRADKDGNTEGFNLRLKDINDPWEYGFADDDEEDGIHTYEQLVELYEQFKTAKYMLLHGRFVT